MEGSTARPTSVTVIAWFWIANGVLLVLGALMGLAVRSVVPEMPMGAPVGLPPDVAGVMGEMETLFRHVRAISVVQGLLGVLAVVAGAAFLRLRPWSRGVLEGLSWLSLLSTLAFGVFWMRGWSVMTGAAAPGPGMPVDMDTFRWVGLVAGGVITLLFAVPFAVVIRYLRGATIRAAVAGDSAGQGA
ncbi:hypothetical protein G3N55_09575 [Dissulfurirhabdus thermomarina]|uniref:Uncharacterized protein n=1 Tax=Dissulfurirhabdus thermomarina TaxID=1765737 RepID=A0A6N9TPJ6_DISTH|nr:hypothetical protein [Dissulfurirhabdus thermomarina]NDY43089.1 hypothetical protein [Dissulfurirhabdus thermomarina]NMX22694.1 hypothetical protein [Dissulfurirhabdus thermomarina]